jgi:hypothetical protein
MDTPRQSLSLIDRGDTRKFVAILFLGSLVLGVLVLFPDISAFYHQHSGLEDFLATTATGSGLCMALLELKHSGEANEHRAELVRLTDKANDLYKDANKYREETLALQTRIHVLQEEIERKLTKIRLYARAHNTANAIELLVSNLSDFDLWINQIRLIVTEAPSATPGTHVIGGGKRISRGHTEDGYQLYGSLISVNGNRTDRIDMKFYVQIEAVGVADDPVTINSPEYHFTYAEGRARELKVLRYL